MDVLVKWKSGRKNVVSSKDIQPVIKNSVLRKGVRVKMYWPPKKKYYFGTVLHTEIESDTSNDNFPLSVLLECEKQSSTSQTTISKCKNNNESEDEDIPLSILKESLKTAVSIPSLEEPCAAQINKTPIQTPTEVDLSVNTSEHVEEEMVICNNADSNEHLTLSYNDCADDSGGRNDPHNVQNCEFHNCKGDVFAAWERCMVLLCWDHFEINENCRRHGDISAYIEDEFENNASKILNTEPNSQKVLSVTNNSTVADIISSKYAVDGEKRETRLKKKIRTNQKNIAHELKAKAYLSPATKKHTPAKFMKPRCDQSKCSKNCISIDDEQRKKIFEAFYETNSLQLQREFIVRYVESQNVKRKRAKAANSRRRLTYNYNLPTENQKISVCRSMFINTLGISEKTLRTAMSKITAEGMIEKERRGGR